MKKQLLSALFLLAGLGMAETAAAQTQAYVHYPLRRNNQDSAAVRSAGVTATPSTFKYFVLSNGQLNGQMSGAVPPYSSRGQAFGPNPEAINFSSLIGTGPRRNSYEQFSITATAPIRIDSLILGVRAAQSANGVMGMSYSLSNYTQDSANFANGRGPVITGSGTTNTTPGGMLPASNNGNFPATGIATQTGAIIPQNNAANPRDDFHFAFVGTGNGITLQAGQTLTVRLSFRVGSGNALRYIILHDVIFKSRQPFVPFPTTITGTRSIVETSMNVYPNPAQDRLAVPHAAASRDARITVYNATGAIVSSQAAQPGAIETNVDLSSLAKGLYLVKYADGEQRSSARVVKE